jgi:hypothetical protein
VNSTEKTGRIRVTVHGKDYSATWRVVGQRVEISSSVGDAGAPLGGLVSAPASVAVEKFKDMIKLATRPPKTASDRARFNVRDA